MRGLLVSAALSLLVAPPAVACINGMREQRRTSTNDLHAQARTALEGGRYVEASDKAEEALLRKPDENLRKSLLKLRGLANLKLGRFALANESFTLVLKTSKEPFVRGKLSESKLRAAEDKGQVDADAKAELEKLVEDGVFYDPDGLVALARARARSGDREGALAAVRAALTAAPGHPEAEQLGKELKAMRVPEAPPAKPSSKS